MHACALLHSSTPCSCDDNPSVCRHLIDTGAIASIFTIASQPAAPTVRALGACIIASAVGPSPDSLAVLLLVLQAAFAINVVDASLELCGRLAAHVRPLIPVNNRKHTAALNAFPLIL